MSRFGTDHERNRIEADMHRHKDKHTFLTSMNEKDKGYQDTPLVTKLFMWGVLGVLGIGIVYAIFFW